MRALRFVAPLLVVLLGCADDSLAYTLIRSTADSAPKHWPASALPVTMRLNDQTGPGLPNVTAGSDPAGAVQRALTKFPAVSGIELQMGTTSVASAGSDGVDIITFADTPTNRSMFEMAGGNGVVGLTLLFSSGSDIVEADLMFNPALQFTTTLDNDDALYDAGLFDVEAVATHELGHVIGLHHTGIESATMWPLTSVLQRRLDADDIAGARTLYPVDPSARGTIAGAVTVAGASAFGAHVVAMGPDGALAASALTLPDGHYAIEQLPPGDYNVYVEPLDGPQSSVPDDPCVRAGNLSGAGIYSGATLTTDFPTTFLPGVVVAADMTATADFALPSGAPPVNPVRIGAAVVTETSVSAQVATHPLPLTPGTDQWIAVAGPNADQVPIDGIDLGPDILVDQASRHVLASTCNGAPFPYLLFRVDVAASAAGGGRAIVLTTGGHSVTLTGGVRVAAAPPPCVGDCDGNGVVDVGELITGIDITLGNLARSECAVFDVNDDQAVSVDELAQGVRAALETCQ